jgi:hypothetical protein
VAQVGYRLAWHFDDPGEQEHAEGERGERNDQEKPIVRWVGKAGLADHLLHHQAASDPE